MPDSCAPLETALTYSVLLTDGTRHPAADLPTLNAWAAEGRITRETLLAPEGSGATIAAGTVRGIVFPETTAVRSQFEGGMSTELRSAWICAALAIFGGIVPCFGRISGAGAILGLILSVIVVRRGEPGAILSLVANLVGLAAAVGWGFLAIRLLGG